MDAKLYGHPRKSEFWKSANFKASPTLRPKQCKRYGHVNVMDTFGSTWACVMAVFEKRYGHASLRGGVKPQYHGIGRDRPIMETPL